MASVTNATNAAATTPAKTNTSTARLADNFDQFLQILTTQLKNQSPLDPLDTNQFTQQLVQFSGVEQQLRTNDQLAQLLAANKTSSTVSALGFVGAKVTADGASTQHTSGSASTWNLNAARGATGKITITDKTGATVHSMEQALVAGNQTFKWDGRLANGQMAPSGTYTISVAAKDATGGSVTVKSEITGTVDAVDVTGDSPILKIGEISVPMSAVKSIQRI
jgi:flagellar basal-body rod modification protein FlgD